MGCEKRHHAEGSAEFGHALPEYPFADDPEPRSGEVPDGMVEEAELAGLLPFAPQHVLAKRNDAAPKREDEREGVLRDGVRRVVPDVRDSDPGRIRRALINTVGSGCRYGDQLELGQGSENVRREIDLVDQCYRRPGEPLLRVLVGRRIVFDPLVSEAGATELGLRSQGGTIEKDNPVHRALLAVA